MSITMLSTELLYRVLDYALPYDFESLALSSKTLYSVAKPKIASHNERRKRFRDFKFDQIRGSHSIQSVPQLLMEIALYPSVANRIHHINMAHRQPHDQVLRLDEGRDTEAKLKGNSSHLHQLLKQASYLTEIDSSDKYIDKWLNVILGETLRFHQRIDYATAFLLTLLPNLETLSLSAHWSHRSISESSRWSNEAEVDEFGRGVHDLVQGIIKRANDASRTGQSLAKLHTMHPTHDADTQSGMDMRGILPFMALDSLRIVHSNAGFCEEEEPPKKAEDDKQYDGQNCDQNSDQHRVKDNDDQESCNGNNDGYEYEDYEEYDDDNSDDNSDDEEERYQYHYENKIICSRYPILGRNIEEMYLKDYVIESGACGVLFKDMCCLKI